MSQEERFGIRDLTYSQWHRAPSLARFVPKHLATAAAQIDMDAAIFIEYDDGTKVPVALIEFAQDTGGPPRKASTITKALARLAGVPAFVVLYTIGTTENPAAPGYRDITMFRVRKVNPEPESRWMMFTPSMWAQKLLSLRGYCADIAGLESPHRPEAA